MNPLSRTTVVALTIVLPLLAAAQDPGIAQPPPVAAAPAPAAPPSPAVRPAQPIPAAYPAQPQGRNQAAPQPYPAPAYRAAAPNPAPSTYLGVALGVLVPKHDDLEGFDNGLALEGTIGYRFNENLALELGIGRLSMNITASGYNSSGIFVTVDGGYVIYPVTGSVKLILPADKLDVYALLGGGFYFLTTKVTASAPGYRSVSESESDSPFGFHAGGGLDVRLSPRATLGAELKYVIGTEETFGAKTHFDSVIVAGALKLAM